MSGKRWADEDSSDEDEDLRQYRTDLQEQPKAGGGGDDGGGGDGGGDGFFDRQLQQEQQDRRYQQKQQRQQQQSGGSYRQSQEPQRKGRGGGGGGNSVNNNRDRGSRRGGGGKGGGGGGGGRTDWKAEARASSQFSASAMPVNNQKLDGSSWMAKRRSKMEEQEAEVRKINEERRARADKEAAERRAKQAEVLEVSSVFDSSLCCGCDVVRCCMHISLCYSGVVSTMKDSL
jgi:hypothetical protein